MPPEWIGLIRDGGPVTILAFVLWLIVHGDLVTKGAHADVSEDRDFWRTLALRGTELAKDAVEEVRRR